MSTTERLRATDLEAARPAVTELTLLALNDR